MQRIELTNFICNYRYDYYGHPKTLVLSNSLGTNFSMWDDNIPFLSNQFNILRYDSRGHGESTINDSRVSIADLGNDVIELLNQLGMERVYFCGLSIGGLVGQWLGVHHPDRFDKIIISNTAAKIGTEVGWYGRIKSVSENGLGSIAEATAERWFSPNYRRDQAAKVQKILQDFQQTSLMGYTACCYAVGSADFSHELEALQPAVLIVVGTVDEVTTLADGQYLLSVIPHSELTTLPAAHLSNMEYPEAFSKRLIDFIHS